MVKIKIIPNMGSFNRKLYVDFKNGLIFENPITNESVDPYSPFFLGHFVYIYVHRINRKGRTQLKPYSGHIKSGLKGRGGGRRGVGATVVS